MIYIYVFINFFRLKIKNMSFIYNSKTGNIKDRGLTELYTEQTVVLNSAKKLAVYFLFS